ncbi:DNA sulfur modification protein DndE [Desulfitobacterium metallireducens]|uniref:DNA sulfur modification protein DndE n=1 Tax=Desulfitobacterium metallireducens DSM 15288 TaxID=871968 RepID=W0E949_9FIRM|nr:DNA sulfur modification protein DndE [Desulfitobacterium metallireducens]AHF06058.1 DNA sulfur modification protein DndE [Desulfitobacterium metallireducens DSM 15288]
MIVKQIKLSNQSKDKLSRLKGKTGIKNWNVLCRWALCFSLSEETIPTDLDFPADSNVEMSWHTFAGENHEIYNALILAWCIKDGLPTDEETLAKYFKLHLNRGIAYLSGTNVIKSIDDLVNLALKKSQEV